MSGPTTIAEWPKNEREVVRIVLDEFNGRPIVNARVWFRPEGSDELRPGKSGIAMSVQHLPALAAAFNEALRIAIERGDISGQRDAR